MRNYIRIMRTCARGIFKGRFTSMFLRKMRTCLRVMRMMDGEKMVENDVLTLNQARTEMKQCMPAGCCD